MSTPHPSDPRRLRVGVLLFLAAEAMFFLAVIAAWMVLRQDAAPLPRGLFGWPPLVVLALAVLVTYALPSRSLRAALTGGLTLCFLVLLSTTIFHQMRFVTLVADSPQGLRVYHGERGFLDDAYASVNGISLPLSDGFDIHAVPPALSQGTMYKIPIADIRQEISNGPWRNNLFACFYLLSTSLAVHVIAIFLTTIWLDRAAGPMWIFALLCGGVLFAMFNA